MNALIQKIIVDDEILQDVGIVVDVEDNGFLVQSEAGQFHTKRAVSCLVEPEKDDEVLFAGRQTGDLFILAVLERPEGTVTRLCLPGDLTVQLKQGRFVVAAADGVDLVSTKDVTMTSQGLRVRANEGHLFFNQLHYLGSRAVAELEQVKTVIGLFDSVLERFSQRVKRSYRFVEEIDQLRAEQVDYAAKQNLRLRGKNALITAKALVKVDGDQIHLG